MAVAGNVRLVHLSNNLALVRKSGANTLVILHTQTRRRLPTRSGPQRAGLFSLLHPVAIPVIGVTWRATSISYLDQDSGSSVLARGHRSFRAASSDLYSYSQRWNLFISFGESSPSTIACIA